MPKFIHEREDRRGNNRVMRVVVCVCHICLEVVQVFPVWGRGRREGWGGGGRVGRGGGSGGRGSGRGAGRGMIVSVEAVRSCGSDGGPWGVCARDGYQRFRERRY